MDCLPTTTPTSLLFFPPVLPQLPRLASPPSLCTSDRQSAASDGVGDAVLGGGVLLHRGRPIRAGRPPRRPLRRRRRHRRQAGPSPLLRHLLGRRPLGHLHRRHHHVQEPAEAPVREPAEQDVPGLLHAHLCLRRHLRRRLRVPPPLEDFVQRGALPARVPPLRSRLQPLQPAGLHPHDHRDDEEEAQDRAGPEHRRGGRVVEEPTGGQKQSYPRHDEQEVRDDPRALVTGQHHVVRQPGHALLVPRQQARAVMGGNTLLFTITWAEYDRDVMAIRSILHVTRWQTD